MSNERTQPGVDCGLGRPSGCPDQRPVEHVETWLGVPPPVQVADRPHPGAAEGCQVLLTRSLVSVTVPSPREIAVTRRWIRR